MFERDYPVGHPAASDYAGQEYTPPRAPFSEDFPPDNPARGGGNTKAADTPDGKHEASVQQWKASAARMAQAEPPAPEPVTPVADTTPASGNTTVTITGEVQTT